MRNNNNTNSSLNSQSFNTTYHNSLSESNDNPLTFSLMNSFMDADRENYNPFRVKASILEAQKHGATTNLGPVVIKEGKAVISKSNQKPVRETYSFWTWSWNLISQGAIIPSYFNFRTQLFVLTFVLTLQAGYSLYSISQLYCDANFTDKATRDELCRKSWKKYYLYTVPMVTYKREGEEIFAFIPIFGRDMQILSWISLLLLFFCRLFFHFGQKIFEDGYEDRRTKLRQKNSQNQYEDYNYRPQDYTVMVGDVHKNTTEKQIEEFIKAKENSIGRIVKVVKATPLTQYKLYEIEARKQEANLFKLNRLLRSDLVLEPPTLEYLKKGATKDILKEYGIQT